MLALSRRLAAFLTLCLALSAMAAGAAFAAPGELDPTFSGDGSAFVPLTDDENLTVTTPRVTQAPDATLVAAVMLNADTGCQFICGERAVRGKLPGEIRVLRFSEAGDLIDQADYGVSGEILDIRVLADGTITIVWRDGPDQLHAVQLTPALDYIDDAFRDASDHCASESETEGELVDAAIRADGTIASAWNCDGDLVELLDGDLEPIEGFDGGDLGALFPIQDLALNPSGVIHILTSAEGEVRVSRLLPSGDLDLDYGVDGEAVYTDANHAPGPRPFPAGPGDGAALAADSAGRAVVALNTNSGGSWEHVRFTPAGDLDEAFGTEGVSTAESELVGAYPTHLTIQRDDKILAVGWEYIELSTRVVGDGNGLVLLRLQANGTPDPGFGAGGFVHLEPDEDDAQLDPPGPALEQADGRIVLPSAVPLWFSRDVIFRTAVPTPPAGESYLALFRLGDKPASPATPAQPQAVQQAQQQQKPPASCASRRAFRIRIRERRSRPIRRAVVRVNGRRVSVRRRSGRLTATVRLATLPKGRFSVRISVRYRDGGKRSYTRRYRTCAPKLRPSNKLDRKNAL